MFSSQPRFVGTRVHIGILLFQLAAHGCSNPESTQPQLPQSQSAAGAVSTRDATTQPMAATGAAPSAGATTRAAAGGASAMARATATQAPARAATSGSGGSPVGGASGAAPTGALSTMNSSVAGTVAAAGTGGAPGTAGQMSMPTTACAKGVVKASEVVFIGESFIAATNAIPRMTSQLARDAGTIGKSDSYRTFAVSGTQLTTGDIPGQYMRAKAESPVKVVLMDGGGNDLLIGNRCKGGFDASCKEVVDVVSKLLGTFAADGVKDVLYFFYPDPMGIGAQIKEAMDILRPEMKKLCDSASNVRCVWVDQRETWEGNYDKFTSDGIHPTDAGSMASAKQIWEAMVAHCIAQ